MKFKKLTAIILAAFLTVGAIPMDSVMAYEADSVSEAALSLSADTEAAEDAALGDGLEELSKEQGESSEDISEPGDEDGNDAWEKDPEAADPEEADTEEYGQEEETEPIDEELPEDVEEGEAAEAAVVEEAEDLLGDSTTGMTLDANGGKFSDGRGTKKLSSATYYLESYVPTRENYVFEGWYSSADCLETELLSDESYPRRLDTTPEEGTTVYAGWTDDYYTVTFDMGDGYYQDYGTGNIKKTQMVYLVPKTHRLGMGNGYYYPSQTSAIHCNDNSYSFDKWTLTPGGDDVVYTYNYELTDDVTIYANYKQDQYLLTYHSNYSNGTYEAYFRKYDYDDEGHGQYFNNEAKTERISRNSGYKSISFDKPSDLYMTNPRLAFVDWYLDAACTQSPIWYKDYDCTEEYVPGEDSYRYLKVTEDTELFAKWTDSNVLLSFDPNGGFFYDSNTDNKRLDGSKEFGYQPGAHISYLYVYNPKNDDLHKKFLGWFDNQGCTGDPVFEPEDSSYIYLNDYTINEDTTFYAGWTDAYNVVTFDMNGGLLASYYDPMKGQYVYDANAATVSYSTKENNELDNYPSETYAKWEDGTRAFEGWFTDAEGGEEIDSLYNYVCPEDTTIYAHWIPVYTVTFDANGGRFKTNGHYNDDDEYVYDYVPTRIGKTGSGGKITSYPYDSDIFWWANGAISDAKAFEGWYVNGEKVEESLYNYIPTSDLTFVARWVDSYTITFDANGGKIRVNGRWDSGQQQTVYDYVDSVQRKTRGDGTIISYVSYSNAVWWENGAVSDAMLCMGWYDSADETRTLIEDMSSFKPSGDTVLKAKYIPVRTVTFDANGGKIKTNGHYDSGEYVYDEVDSVEYKTNNKGIITNRPYDSNVTPPENSNSLFTGWYLQGDDTFTLLDLSTYVPEGNVTLLAFYRPIYDITFDANGGYIKEGYYDTEGSATKVLKTGAKGTIANTWDVPGEYYVGHSDLKKTFEGWYTLASGGELIDFSEYVFSGNTTVYAHYSSLFEITFDATGGKIRYWDNGEYKYADTRSYITENDGKLDEYPHDDNVTRDNYNFIGWFIKGTSTKVEDLYDYVFTADTTLEAHWGKKCKVTFDAGSGKFTYYDSEQGKDVTASKATFIVNDSGRLDHYPSDPVISGKSFMGWYTTTGIRIDSFWDFQPADDVTLTARYNTPFSITFDGKGGTFTYYDYDSGQYVSDVKTAVIKTRGEDNYISGLPSNVVPSDSTMIFDGWYIGDRKLTGSYYEFDKNTTITAKYVKYYTVTFISMGGYYLDDNGDEIRSAQILKVPVGKSLEEGVGEIRELKNEDENVEFAGWYLDTNFGDNSQINEESYVPAKDTNVYAYWPEVHSVTFEAGFFNEIEGTIEGTNSHSIVYKVRHGEKLRYVDDASVPGVKFNLVDAFFLNGWFDVADMTVSKVILSDEEILDRVVDKDITYMAEVTLGRTLSFYSNGGRFKSVKEVVDGCGFYSVRITTDEYHASVRGKEPVVVRDDDPEHPDVHWVFAGWFYDEECTIPANLYDLNKPGYDTIDLYAGWSQSYALTFHTNKEGATFKNGKDTVTVKVVKGETFRFGEDSDKLDVVGGNPELKTKPADSFPSRGWYTNAECTEGFQYSVGGMDGIYGFIPTEDMDFYIKWHDYADGVDVTFDANGGIFSSSKYWWDGYGEPRLDIEHKQWTVTVPRGITWGELDSITDFPYSFDSRPAGMRYNNWKYEDPECKKFIRDDVVIDEDITVYCYWYPKSSGGTPESEKLNKVTYHACEGYYKVGKRRRKTVAGSYKIYNASGNVNWYSFEAPQIDDDTLEFSGWFLDPERTIPYYDGHYRVQYNWGYYSYEIRFPQEVTDLYAGYSTSYQVEFNANGGYFDNDYNRAKEPAVKMRNRYIIETKLSPGQVVIVSEINRRIRRDGDMLFGGWYLDAACTPGNEAGIYAVDNEAELFKPTSNITLYAKWISYEKPASVEIAGDAERNIDIGTTVKLEAVVTPAEGQTVTGDVHWFISEYDWDYDDGFVQQCAKLDSDGLVTGLSHGYCKIYAEVNGIRSETVTVNVSDKVVENNMTLDITSPITMYSGGARTVHATITPENLADTLAGSIKWSSTDTAVVSIAKSGNGSQAILTAGTKEGEATISAKLDEITRSFTVRVITAVKLDRTEIVLSAMEGASTTVQTTYVSALQDSLTCKITNKSGDVYEGVSIVKSGAPTVDGDKSKQNWVIKVDSDLDLQYVGEAVVTAFVTGEDGMLYRHSANLTLNPRGAVGAVRVNIGRQFEDETHKNATDVVKGTKVLLHCDTEDSDIWYTTDGTDPVPGTAPAVLYTDAVVINATTTLKAVAVKTGRRNSAIYRFDYIVEDWGDAEEYKDAFDNNIALVPDGVWYVIGDMIYTEVGNGATTFTKTYTGNKITFNDEVKVFNGIEKLIESRDYTLSYANNTAVAGLSAKKVPSLTVKGKGNYTKNATFKFTIEPYSFNEGPFTDNVVITSECVVTVAAGPKVKLGNTKPVITFMGKKLSLGKDYELTYYEGDAVDASKKVADPANTLLTAKDMVFTIQITGKNGSNFTDAMTETVKVVTVDGKDTSVVQASKVKVGNAQGKAITVPYKTGEYTAEELFDNSAQGSSPFGFVYAKSAADPFTYGVDYEVELVGDAASAGKQTFVIVGKEGGRIVGSKTGTFTIAEAVTWKNVKIAGLATSVEYTGEAITLDDLFNPNDKVAAAQKWDKVTLYTTLGNKVLKVYDATNPNGAVLDASYDCIVSYANTGVVGKFDVLFVGINGLTGSTKKTITVKTYNLNDTKKGAAAKISVSAVSTTYTKAGAKPEVTVKYGDRELREGIDYTVTYKNNTKVVTDYNTLKASARPTAIVKGKGNYTGSNATAYFNIFKADVEEAVTLSVADVVYNPKGKSGYKLAVPKLMDGGKAVTAGKNKDVDAISKWEYNYYYAEDTELTDGTKKYAEEPLYDSDAIPDNTLIRVTVTVHISSDPKVRTKESPYYATGAGDSAVLEGYYRFVGAGKDISKMSASIKKGVTYSYHNGDEIIPVKTKDISVTYKENGQTKELCENDFEIVSVSQNRFLGTATVVIRGKKPYGGTKTLTFKIVAQSFN
jgi:uncharacterized repeat protein (TIGR02543 family)